MLVELSQRKSQTENSKYLRGIDRMKRIRASNTSRRLGTLVVAVAGISIALAQPAAANDVAQPRSSVQALTGVQLADAAVAGLERRASPVGPDNTFPEKSITVTCRLSTQRVVGGGAVINDHGQNRVFLRFMQPNLTQFSVAAAAPVGFSGTWSLQAYAICANLSALPGYEIVPAISPAPLTSTSQAFVAVCPSSKQVIGAGGGIVGGGREVGLQAFRSDGARGITRVFGREDADGFSGTWRLQAFAICTNPIPNSGVESSLQPGDTGRQFCSSGRFLHGTGGGAGDGAVFLRRVLPSADLRQLEVASTGVSATGVLVHMICAV